MNTALCELELLRLRKKTSVWFLLLLSIGIGFAISFIILTLQDELLASESIQVLDQGTGQSLGIQSFFLDLLGRDIASITGKALWFRNFYIIPLLLIYISADISMLQSSKLLREMLCQPITRTEIYLYKMGFLSIISLISLAATIIPTVLIASFHLEEWGAWKDLFGGIILCWISDIALFGMVFALSSVFKTSGSGSTTILVLFLLIVEKMISGFLYFVFFINQDMQEIGDFIYKLMPSSALSCWSLWSSNWDWFLIGYLLFFSCAIHIFAMHSFTKQQV